MNSVKGYDTCDLIDTRGMSYKEIFWGRTQTMNTVVGDQDTLLVFI